MFQIILKRYTYTYINIYIGAIKVFNIEMEYVDLVRPHDKKCLPLLYT